MAVGCSYGGGAVNPGPGLGGCAIRMAPTWSYPAWYWLVLLTVTVKQIKQEKILRFFGNKYAVNWSVCL